MSDAPLFTGFADALLDALFHLRKDGKWMKSCRPKKGRRVKSGDWWRRPDSERPWRAYRHQETQEFNGFKLRYSDGTTKVDAPDVDDFDDDEDDEC